MSSKGFVRSPAGKTKERKPAPFNKLPRLELEKILHAHGLKSDAPAILAELNAHTLPDGTVNLASLNEASPILKALTETLAVPNWQAFKKDVREIMQDISREVHGGKNADYIPILAEQNPDWFGVAITTVDGQQLHFGDSDLEFSIQSCVKPLTYCLAVEEAGLRKTHRHIGIEPSGLAFNEVSLNADNKPHNPMINAGAIVAGSLIQPNGNMAMRFRYFMQRMRELAGGESVGFSQSTYLCEHETAWRNNALMYYMTEAGVFPSDFHPEEILDFYIQCCAVEVTAESAATLAATLAKGGVCPLTDQRVISSAAVRSCLTLMMSCGMYDYSGEWATYVGLPAKSGVAGLIYIVVPNIMGIAVWSPPLDSHGNSVRGVEFCKRLLARYRLGIFDQIILNCAYRISGDRFTHGIGMIPPREFAALERQRSLGDCVDKDSPEVSGTAGGGARSRASSSASIGENAEAFYLSAEADMQGGDGGSATTPTPRVTSDAQKAAARATGKLQWEIRRRDAFRRIAHRLALIKQSFNSLSGDRVSPVAVVSRACVESHLHELGFDPVRNVLLRETLDTMEQDSGIGGEIHFRALFLPSVHEENLVLRALEGRLMMQNYSELRLCLTELYQHSKELNPEQVTRQAIAGAKWLSQPAGTTAPTSGLESAPGSVNGLRGDGIGIGRSPATHPLHAPSSSQRGGGVGGSVAGDVGAAPSPEEEELAPFGVAFCTVDGQQFSIGDVNLRLPLMEAVHPLLYAIAMNDVGMKEVDNWVGFEPTQSDPTGFHFLKPGKKELEAAKAEAQKAEDEMEFLANEGPPIAIDNSPLAGPIGPPTIHTGHSRGSTAKGGGTGTGTTGGDPLSRPTLDRIESTAKYLVVNKLPKHSEVPTPSKPDKARASGAMRPYHPYTATGALAVCSVIGGGHRSKKNRAFHDSGSRYDHILSNVKRLCGYKRISYNNPAYLALKQRGLRAKALSNYMKGMNCYPKKTDPTDNANVYFQSCSIEMTPEHLAVVAATLAGGGRCPLTGERCLPSSIMKRVLSSMYCCGLNRFTGRWNFTVGSPAVYSSSGLLMVVIPNIGGLVIYSPYKDMYTPGVPRSIETRTVGRRRSSVDSVDVRGVAKSQYTAKSRAQRSGRGVRAYSTASPYSMTTTRTGMSHRSQVTRRTGVSFNLKAGFILPILSNTDAVEHRAFQFCESLSHKYRINVFDHLVHIADDVHVKKEEQTSTAAACESGPAAAVTENMAFFALCTACAAGNVEEVQQLLDDGANAARADYDHRTPLHLAASEGHFEVAQLLINAGADPKAKDRWGNSPLDDARRIGAAELVSLFENDVYGSAYTGDDVRGAMLAPGAGTDGTSGATGIGNINGNGYISHHTITHPDRLAVAAEHREGGGTGGSTTQPAVVDGSSVGVSEEGGDPMFHRGNLLVWINDVLRMEFPTIEDACKPSVLCMLFDAMRPDSVPMELVVRGEQTSMDRRNNVSVLQEAFRWKKIKKTLDAHGLSSGSTDVTLGTVRWLRSLFDAQIGHKWSPGMGPPHKGYDPAARRALARKRGGVMNQAGVAGAAGPAIALLDKLAPERSTSSGREGGAGSSVDKGFRQKALQVNTSREDSARSKQT